MQEEFQNQRVVFGERLLEVIDVLIAKRPDRFRDQLMHPRDQDIFIMRAVEHRHDAALGNLLVKTPEKIVRFLEGRWRFERNYPGALRARLPENRPDRSVLAGSVDALQYHQEAMRSR